MWHTSQVFSVTVTSCSHLRIWGSVHAYVTYAFQCIQCPVCCHSDNMLTSYSNKEQDKLIQEQFPVIMNYWNKLHIPQYRLFFLFLRSFFQRLVQFIKRKSVAAAKQTLFTEQNFYIHLLSAFLFSLWLRGSRSNPFSGHSFTLWTKHLHSGKILNSSSGSGAELLLCHI